MPLTPFHVFPASPVPINYTVLAIISVASVALILPSYFVGKKINRGSPFKKLP